LNELEICVFTIAAQRYVALHHIGRYPTQRATIVEMPPEQGST